MRFGAALDLWHKGDLSSAVEAVDNAAWVSDAEGEPTAEGVLRIWTEARAAGADVETLDKLAVLGRERREAEKEVTPDA